MKRQKALLDECVKHVKKAAAATSEAEREEAVRQASKALDAVRVLADKIDGMFAERIDDITRLRRRTREQSEEAIAAAQVALARAGGALRDP